MGLEDPFHGIAAGQSYTYYTLEMKCTHQTEHGKACGPLIPIGELKDPDGEPKKSGWGAMSWDNWGSMAEPWGGRGGNDWKPLYKEAHDETHDVWSCTGRHGWWTRKYADLAMGRMQKASAEHKMVYKDGYSNIVAVKQFDFRVVKITVSKTVEVMDPVIILPPNVAAADPLPEHLVEFYAFETVGYGLDHLRRGLVLDPGPTIPLTSGEEGKVVPLTANP